ncbi:GPW/gp25 family protein [Xenorhabdus cabanillasii]|uniref:Baseplate assembly protein W n=1 Tax=Xenorhabdus cabanillasii JM26 TaxID=1427517 RepID=W1JBH3_9GAMM|nr:GPW/gp25 family protein [Xenorhabdus cabanillasii]PHM76610.1 baseplate assembly protein [Xenorhabdus cabanillasii JM26]CDL87256.1 Baseplate assembly protein W [Xenorhabdus cabanillasii JM26]
MTFTGMSSQTGCALSDSDHIRQSITDILMTPLGSRVMRREYGSLLPDPIDQPQNPALRLKIMSACYMALLHWEPRIRLDTINYLRSDWGELAVEISGVMVQNNTPLMLSIPVR